MTQPSRRTLRLTLSAALAAIALSASLPAAAQSPTDDAAVRDVVTRLFEAMAARDTATMATLFAPGARFAGVDREGSVSYTTPGEFLDAVAGATGPHWIERTYDTEVRIDGPLASVWTYYTLHLDEQFSHCGYDAFQMLKLDGAWKIVHLADSRRREDCREQ